MIKFYVAAICSSLLVSCNLVTVGAIPVNLFSNNLLTECSIKLDADPLGGPECMELNRCADNLARGTGLYQSRNWQMIKRIIPDTGYPNYNTVSEMRFNAQQTGPRAVELFNTIYEIRNQCLIETGLRGRINDN